MQDSVKSSREAAFNMAHSQLVTEGVQDPAVIGALCLVPWEALPDSHAAGVAYSDAAVACRSGLMLPPAGLGKTLVLLAPSRSKRLLIAGAGFGAEACAAAALFGSVTLADPDAAALNALQSVVPASVTVRAEDPFSSSFVTDEPFDTVLISSCAPLGAPPVFPDRMITDGGTIVYFSLMRKFGLLTAWIARHTHGSPPVFYPDFQFAVNPDLVN